jgi:hypothetical protein
MRSIAFVVLIASLTSIATAQNAAPSALPVNSALPAALASDLDRLQAAAWQGNLDIAHMRIEKWKADAASKQQAQANADSLQRNLTSALPGLIDSFRAAPQDLNAGFKLYRNLNALYDVFASFAESAGAFGPRSDYEALAQPLNVIDSVRHDLGDDLERLTSSTQSELTQLRTQVRSLQQASAAAPPKKVVVDDTEPEKKKTAHKKKATTTATTGSTSGTNANGASGTPSPTAKAQ